MKGLSVLRTLTRVAAGLAAAVGVAIAAGPLASAEDDPIGGLLDADVVSGVIGGLPAAPGGLPAADLPAGGLPVGGLPVR